LDSRSRAANLLALVPAAAVPLIFLHRRYQVHVSIGPADVYGSDVAVIAMIVAAIVAAVLLGPAPLARAKTLWLTGGAFLGLLVVSCFWTPLERSTTHLTSAAKIVEYALMAPALVLVLRAPAHVDRFLAAIVAWSVAASGWGLLQFLGIVNEFEGKRPGQREVSFLGNHDFGAFSAAALAIGLTGLALGERRRLALVALVAGSLGVILSASLFVYVGVLLAAVGIGLLALRARKVDIGRALVLAGVVLVIGAGVFGLRVGDVSSFFSFLGSSTTSATQDEGVQTGSQRTLLAYIGLRVWLDHPILGVGFDRSANRYQPYLADARRRFPDQPALAYPSPDHPWGVQNFWVQLLADLGIVGLLLAVGTFVVALGLAVRAPPEVGFVAVVAAGWILVAAGSWNDLGIVAGIPLQAVMWLGFGLAAWTAPAR
jgi:O-antigen ligase